MPALKAQNHYSTNFNGGYAPVEKIFLPRFIRFTPSMSYKISISNLVTSVKMILFLAPQDDSQQPLLLFEID